MFRILVCANSTYPSVLPTHFISDKILTWFFKEKIWLLMVKIAGGSTGGLLPKWYPYCMDKSSYSFQASCFVDQLYVYEKYAYYLNFDFW